MFSMALTFGLLWPLFEPVAFPQQEVWIALAVTGTEQSLIDEAPDPGEATTGRPCVGFALTKAIVEQHGGSLEVDSEPGGGTYAQIRLPLRD